MVALFADLPEATENTLEIAQRCAFRPKTRKPILPNYTLLDGSPLDAALLLREQAEAGLTMRLRTRRRGARLSSRTTTASGSPSSSTRS